MHRARTALLAALPLALACGGGGSRTPSGLGDGAACTRSSECRAGLSCFSKRCAVAAPAAASCALPHAPGIVLGAVAGPSSRPAATSGTCVLPVRSASYPAADVQELGIHDVGTTLTFDIRPGTVGFSVVSQEVDGSAPDEVTLANPPLPSVTIPNSVVPTDFLAAGSSAKFFDDRLQVTDPASVLAYYGGLTPAQGAFTVPNTSPSLELVRSAGELPPGTWSLTVNDFARECPSYQGCSVVGPATGRYDVKVLTRPGPLASTGTLDVDLYLVLGPKPAGEPGTSARTAAALLGDPQLARYVAGLSAAFARAGVCLGTVTLHDLPDWAIQDFAQMNVDSTGPCDPLSKLFSLAVERNALHLFLVDSLVETTSSGQFILLGMDGSIPGPSGVPGTVNSGAVVLFQGFGEDGGDPRACTSAPFDIGACGTDLVAYVSAHEAGHWLGLYHTTERDGALFDPLTDTATCACASCAPLTRRNTCGTADAAMLPGSCNRTGTTCGGGANLMFWLVDPASTGALSPQQGEVVRANPVVH